jgi:hypothetical protein
MSLHGLLSNESRPKAIVLRPPNLNPVNTEFVSMVELEIRNAIYQADTLSFMDRYNRGLAVLEGISLPQENPQLSVSEYRSYFRAYAIRQIVYWRQNRYNEHILCRYQFSGDPDAEQQAQDKDKFETCMSIIKHLVKEPSVLDRLSIDNRQYFAIREEDRVLYQMLFNEIMEQYILSLITPKSPRQRARN